MKYRERLIKKCERLKIPREFIDSKKDVIRDVSRWYYSFERKHELVPDDIKIDIVASRVARDLKTLFYKNDVSEFNKVAGLWGVDKLKVCKWKTREQHRQEHHRHMLKFETQFVS
ncbi:hypothetical protein [Vibrio campbellii]|uniref:hypothetical protein n=1 Tax=Vibrio campbellii TaxID=680 RepID=UPI003F844B9F